MKVLQEAEVFEKVKGILGQIAPEKVKKGITPESSLINDLGFDQAEIFTTLMSLQSEFFSDNSGQIDTDKFDYTFKVGELCKFIVENSKG
ncbi:MAG TPA: hypothetical protein VHY08_09180 [Bacillota bacterium]|nr:hypothetical protein [Bacillota bacterium]